MAKAKLLVVEDNAVLGKLLTVVLANSGYRVRWAPDGFSALTEMRTEPPEILLSDLNMPRMSGFELLSIVRRRFPAIRVVATSGAYSGQTIPAGVAADAFYEKGTSIVTLLQLLETVGLRSVEERADTQVPLWIPISDYDAAGKPRVMICCPECLRSFSQSAELTAAAAPVICVAECVYCAAPMQYAVVCPEQPVPGWALEPAAGMETGNSPRSIRPILGMGRKSSYNH
jgi:CheY-like chemotaxis protein